MLESVSLGTNLLFGVVTIAAILWYYWISGKSLKVLLGLVGWATIVSMVAWTGFFQDNSTIPPNIMLGIVPVVIFIIGLFLTKSGRDFMDGLNLEQITYAHVLRIPVEIGLAMLAHQGAISVWQTFEGANFDIISGLTAPLIAYLFFSKKSLNRNGLLLWNIACLALLITIIGISIIALPSPLQQIAFEKPNRAIQYFPFNLLPMVIVPLMFFGHLVAIRRILKNKI